jgi:hypothetical protein
VTDTEALVSEVTSGARSVVDMDEDERYRLFQALRSQEDEQVDFKNLDEEDQVLCLLSLLDREESAPFRVRVVRLPKEGEPVDVFEGDCQDALNALSEYNPPVITNVELKDAGLIIFMAILNTPGPSNPVEMPQNRSQHDVDMSELAHLLRQVALRYERGASYVEELC